MTFITLAQAKTHLRIDDSASDADLTLKIAAAQRSVIEYLQCSVYADQTALNTAIAAVPAMLSAAKAAYVIADAAADALPDYDLALDGKAQAMSVYMRAVYAATRVRQGVVINELIQAAMLLAVGHLFSNREDVVVGASVAALPMGSESLLQPFRVYC